MCTSKVQEVMTPVLLAWNPVLRNGATSGMSTIFRAGLETYLEVAVV